MWRLSLDCPCWRDRSLGRGGCGRGSHHLSAPVMMITRSCAQGSHQWGVLKKTFARTHTRTHAHTHARAIAPNMKPRHRKDEASESKYVAHAAPGPAQRIVVTHLKPVARQFSPAGVWFVSQMCRPGSKAFSMVRNTPRGARSRTLFSELPTGMSTAYHHLRSQCLC